MSPAPRSRSTAARTCTSESRSQERDARVQRHFERPKGAEQATGVIVWIATTAARSRDDGLEPQLHNRSGRKSRRGRTAAAMVIRISGAAPVIIGLRVLILPNANML